MCTTVLNLALSWELSKGKYDRVEPSKISIKEFTFSKVAGFRVLVVKEIIHIQEKAYSS